MERRIGTQEPNGTKIRCLCIPFIVPTFVHECLVKKKTVVEESFENDLYARSRRSKVKAEWNNHEKRYMFLRMRVAMD